MLIHRSTLGSTLAMVLVLAAPAMAQNVDNATEHATWVGGLLVVLLTALTVMISIKSSKRGHQD